MSDDNTTADPSPVHVEPAPAPAPAPVGLGLLGADVGKIDRDFRVHFPKLKQPVREASDE